MNKALHGAIIGLCLGSLSVLLAWVFMQQIANTIDSATTQHLIMLSWVIGYTALGALLGAILPKHK